MIGRTLTWLFGPKSKFDVNDTVQLKEGEHNLMVVTEVKAQFNKEPLVGCKWDDHGRGTRVEFFPENKLELFDWDQEYRKVKPDK